ncbi:hypothetical protein [Pseudomonas phage D6]|nr:hypothetical protein [Pseudomonas phage D6]
MCNNTDALKKLINESLVLDGETGLTLTDWHDDTNGRYGTDTQINRITTKYGVVRGRVCIQPGGAHQRSYGFGGFHEKRDGEVPLTIDQVRGVLVTSLAVAQTDLGRVIASGFASIIEKLTANCFIPVSYSLSIEAAEDPTIRVVMTNGMLTVELDARPIEEAKSELKLELPVRYILGGGFATALTDIDSNGRGYSNTGLTVLENGKWVHLTGISVRNLDPEEKANVDRIEPEMVVEHIGEARRPLVLAALKEIIRQLNSLGGDVNIYSVHLGHGDYRREPTVAVSMYNAQKAKHYSLDFKA